MQRVRITAAIAAGLLLGASAPALAALPPMQRIVSARVPLVASTAGRVHVFRPEPRVFYGLEKMWALEAEAKPAKPIRPRRAKTQA